MKIDQKTILGIIVILILIFGGIFFGYTLNSTAYKNISYKEYEKLLNSKEKFVLFIGSDDCSHCTNFKKTITRVIKDYKIEINYINIEKLTNEQLAHIKANYPFAGTPTTIVLKNKKEYKRYETRIDGDKDYKTVVEKLTNAGIIK